MNTKKLRADLTPIPSFAARPSVTLEEYARRLIEEEVRHVGDVDKMLRKPGDIASVAE